MRGRLCRSSGRPRRTDQAWHHPGTLASWREAPVSKADVRALTRDETAKIYRAVYYLGPGIDTLPEGIQQHVFDIAVNSGPRTNVKLLQRVLNRLGERLTVDGVVGPATRAAAAAHPPNAINRALVDVRLAFYDEIVAGDASQVAFIEGWRGRALAFERLYLCPLLGEPFEWPYARVPIREAATP